MGGIAAAVHLVPHVGVRGSVGEGVGGIAAAAHLVPHVGVSDKVGGGVEGSAVAARLVGVSAAVVTQVEVGVCGSGSNGGGVGLASSARFVRVGGSGSVVGVGSSAGRRGAVRYRLMSVCCLLKSKNFSVVFPLALAAFFLALACLFFSCSFSLAVCWSLCLSAGFPVKNTCMSSLLVTLVCTHDILQAAWKENLFCGGADLFAAFSSFRCYMILTKVCVKKKW